MRIAYIAPYQGPVLLKARPIIRNLSLAGNAKILMIAELLAESGHSVEILSQGEVIEHQLRLYAGFQEPEPVNTKIPVYYASALPVKYLNGLWSSTSLLRIFKARHRISPFDVVMIYNLKPPQVACANYAIRRLGRPVVLEYEDDSFADIWGKNGSNVSSRFYLARAKALLRCISGCAGVSPYLLSQAPSRIPKLLLRGVVSRVIARSSRESDNGRKNWVVFSGTLFKSKGLEQVIEAWQKLKYPDWELHIAGDGELRDHLRQIAANNSRIVFHGLLNRVENASLLRAARIGINAHDLSATPGNIFAFKIIEYLAAGTHVISTPMGTLEPQLQRGITYIPDNKPETIAATLNDVIMNRRYEQTAAESALETYGPDAVSKSLDRLITEVTR